jgi:hypothetical protein
MRMRKAPVFHQAVFRELVSMALQGQGCIQHGGLWWEPVAAGPQFGLYRQARNPLATVQEQLECYEALTYGRLLRGVTCVDDEVRPRTQLWQDRDGTFRVLAIGIGALIDD